MTKSNNYVTGTGQTLHNVHSSDQCAGEFCVIHNPSNHVMKNFPTHWRSDRRLMERICPHGIGHPDPDALAIIPKDQYNGEGIHGCDLCCSKSYEESDIPLYNGASDWERGLSWEELANRVVDVVPSVHMCPPGHCPEKEWIDKNAQPNGIGPVCKYCHKLIDWDPFDHALDCARFGTDDGMAG